MASPSATSPKRSSSGVAGAIRDGGHPIQIVGEFGLTPISALCYGCRVFPRVTFPDGVGAAGVPRLAERSSRGPNSELDMANEFFTVIVVPHAKARFRKIQVPLKLARWALAGTTTAAVILSG